MTTLPDDVATLKSKIGQLRDRDASFATSLCQQFDRRGDLSPKQSYWVRRLVATAAGEPTGPQPDATNLEGVPALLTKAAEHLKRPRFNVQVGHSTIRVTLCRKADSPNIGAAYLKERSTYLGKIMPDGKLYLRGSEVGTAGPAIANALRAFADDPASAAAQHGHLHGNCCFCGLDLTDERSVSVGYGPICAGKFGLPWGTRPSDEEATEAQLEIEAEMAANA